MARREADSLAIPEVRRDNSAPGTTKVKLTGLAQNLPQLQASNRHFQLHCWVNLKILGQPFVDFCLRAGPKMIHPLFLPLRLRFILNRPSSSYAQVHPTAAGGSVSPVGHLWKKPVSVGSQPKQPHLEAAITPAAHPNLCCLS